MRWPGCRGCCARRWSVYEPAAGSLEVLRDLPVAVRDGTVLRVNVVLPAGGGRFPVLMSAHPYGKDNLPSRRGRGYRVSMQYRILRQTSPVRFSSLTGWEAPDPAWWAAQGYAVVNCDLRGAGTSGGEASLLSDQEAEDVYDLIEWAAVAVVEHRCRRHARRVVPGDLAVEGRRPAAAAPEGDLPVGRVHRRLPGLPSRAASARTGSPGCGAWPCGRSGSATG